MIKFWVGNSGNFDDSAHWAASSGGAGGAGAPTASDDVIFDNNSFTSVGQTVTIRNGHTNTCKSIDMSTILVLQTLNWLTNSNGDNPVLTVDQDVIIPANVAIQVTLSATGVVPQLTITATTASSLLQIGADMSALRVNLSATSGNTIALSADLTAGLLITTAGSTQTFTTNDHNITTGFFSIGGNTNVNLGASTIHLISTTLGNTPTTETGQMSVGTTGTFNAGTSTISIENSNTPSVTTGISGGGSIFYDIVIGTSISTELTIGAAAQTFEMHNLTLNPGSQLSFKRAASNDFFKIDGQIISNATSGNHAKLKAASWDVQIWNLNSPTNSVLVDYVDVDHSTASGVTPFISAGGIDNGNNTNWSFIGITTTTKTITGLARLQKSVTKTITGKAYIEPPNFPQVVAVSNILFDQAQVQVNVPACLGIEQGLVWATNPSPTISDSHMSVPCSVGSYYRQLTGLLQGTPYYVRTYVKYAGPVYVYGIVKTFTTLTNTYLGVAATDNLLSKYSFEILDASNNLVADVSGIAFNRQFVITRNRAEEITFSIPLFELEKLAALLHMNTPDLLKSGIYTIRVRRKQQIICAGQMDFWEAKFDDPTNPVINVKGHGWLSLLAFRTFGGEYDSKDQNYILRSLITFTQGLTNGDFGMTLGASAVGTNSYAQKIFDNKRIDEIFIEMSDEHSGLDFVFTWDKVLNLYFPTIGSVRDDILFTYPGNTLAINVSQDATKLDNAIFARGQGNANGNISQVEDDVTSQGIYKLRQQVVDFPDMDYDQLVNEALAQIQFYKNPLVLHTVRYDGGNPACPPIGSFSIGDQVRVIVSQLPLYADINTFYTIDKISVTISDEDYETVELSLNNAPS